MAIDNAGLHTETEERLRQTETLLAVSRAVSSTLDLTEIMRRVAREVTRALGADTVGAYLLEDGGSELRPVAGYHVPPQFRDAFVSEGITVRGHPFFEEALANGRPVVSPDAALDSRIARPTRERFGFAAVAFFPMSVKGVAIGGFVAAWWRDQHAPASEQLRLVESVAAQAALAVENARLFQRTERALHETRALLAVTEVATATQDFAEIMRRIAREATRAVGGESALFYVVKDDGGQIVPVAGYRLPPHLKTQGVTPVNTDEEMPVTREALRTGRIAVIEDVGADPIQDGWVKRLGIRAVLISPVRLKEETLGVLLVYWWSRPHRASPEEVALLRAVSGQAALVLANARLFRQTDRALHETRALLAVTESITTVHDIFEVMRRVAREAVRAVGGDSAVYFSDVDGHRIPVAAYRLPPHLRDRTTPVDTDRPIVEDVWETEGVSFIEDVANDPRCEGSNFRVVGARAVLASPVDYQGESFGSIVVFWWSAPHRPTEEQCALLRAIGRQAGLAVANARLFAGSQEHAAALAEKNRELDSFVYSVSHDLKAPLVALQGIAGMLVEDYADRLDDQGRHYLARVEANCSKMGALITDLLALSRIGHEARPTEDVPLAGLVDDVLVELSERIKARGVTVTVGALPVVRALRVHMEQVFRNLLGNAVKYLGDVAKPSVEVGARDRGDVVEVWVRDSGIGIDPAYHATVFETFQRLKDVEVEGSGVGLAIVKKIVDTAGGRIWVESAKGEGATFRFTWPKGEGLTTGAG